MLEIEYMFDLASRFVDPRRSDKDRVFRLNMRRAFLPARKQKGYFLRSSDV
jgi:hypothetical protein